MVSTGRSLTDRRDARATSLQSHYFITVSDEIEGTLVIENCVVQFTELFYRRIVDLRILSSVSHSSYHFVEGVVKPQNVRVRLEPLPVVSVTSNFFMRHSIK